MTPSLKIAISMTHCSRPKYSAQSLECLRRALYHHPVEGGLYLGVEPGNAPTIAVVKDFVMQPDVSLHVGHRGSLDVYEEKQGVNQNTWNVIEKAFDGGADFVVHVEDDILLSADALGYFAWCAQRFAGHEDVLTVTGYNREVPRPVDGHHATYSRVWFHPWGWGTWRTSWQFIRGWLALNHPQTWDVQVNQMMTKANKQEVYPLLARSQNIGLYSSIHPGAFTPEWYAANHVLKHWAGDGEPYHLTNWSFCGLRQGATVAERAKGAL